MKLDTELFPLARPAGDYDRGAAVMGGPSPSEFESGGQTLADADDRRRAAGRHLASIARGDLDP